MAKMNISPIFGKSEFISQIVLKILKYIEYRENFRGIPHNFVIFNTFPQIKKIWVPFDPKKDPVLDFFEKSDFYGCDKVFHVCQNIPTLGIPWELPFLGIPIFMIETHWKCPEEHLKKNGNDIKILRNNIFNLKNLWNFCQNSHGQQVTADMQLPILKSKFHLEILNFHQI